MSTPHGDGDGGQGLLIRELDEDDGELLQATYDAVLRPSFTLDELSGIKAVSPAPGRVVTVALGPGRVPLGCAVSDLDAGGIGLLSYLAVSPDSRSLGVGGRLLSHLAALWAEIGCTLVLAEVHDPRGHVDTADEHPEARLRFYARGGARVLDAPFVQPALAGGERVPDMLLLVMAGPEVPAIPAAPLREWVLQYYRDCEGAEPTDPQGAALLDRFATGQIAVLPLAEWPRVRRLAVD